MQKNQNMKDVSKPARNLKMLLLAVVLLPLLPVPAFASTVIFLTSGTSWTVPSDWNSSNNTIEVIGSGATAANGDSTIGSTAGAGGGAYSTISNISLTNGASVAYQVGIPSGNTDTYFNGSGTTCAAQSVCAKGASGQTGGSAASSVGTATSGGSGATRPAGTAGGGGGGAAGPHGAGAAGSSTTGGTGDSGNTAAGANGTQWDASHGSGGGGAGSISTSAGSSGGLYGAGGGGASNRSNGGAGSQGIIVITYTPAIAPTITTSAASSITSTTATLNGSITATGGADATQSGFAYSTSATLSSGVSTSTLGAQTGTASFNSALSSLSPSTTYYFRAYATNGGGTGYGSILSFTTDSSITAPSITTSAASSITTTTGTLNGSITATGGADATQSGFAYSTNSTLSSGVSTSTLGAQTGTASFNSALTSLIAGTTYYFRAYATNSGGTGYGSILSFSTTVPPARRLILFEGFKLKIQSGKMIIFSN